AAEEDAALGMDFVESPLHGPAVELAVVPSRLGAAAPVGEAGVGRHVVALPVVGLDALYSELEHGSSLAAPPAPCSRRREVDHRAGAHPPAADPRATGGRT